MSTIRNKKDDMRYLLDINRAEFHSILRPTGYSHREFGEFIGKSHTLVGELGLYDGHMPSC